ncbi:MAG: thiamine diphosphokinase [Selenomonadaceae bacterium]|nr:thiamine diphosphokinase [Selenomonadaceae bacterium]
MRDKNYTLKLPQADIVFNQSNLSSELILITGGRKPNDKWFHTLQRDRPIYCVDHGIDFCVDNNIVPKLLIGDCDSAATNSVKWAMNRGVAMERHPVDKDFTDTQLALKHIEARSDTFAIITGAFGGRTDHLFSTIFSCANAKIKNCLIDEREAVIFIKDYEHIAIEFKIRPIALSLLPITSNCKGVTIDGVHWPIKDTELLQSIPYAISNRIESGVVNISIDSGILAVYLCFKENIL